MPYDPRVDDYIAKSADFAKPILAHVRQLVHETSPLITETIKWGFPFFEYKGSVCNMASFKEHCSFGFWRASLLNDPHKALHKGDAAAGSLGRLAAIDDLPGDDILKDLILQAIKLNDGGIKTPVAKKASTEKKELTTPDYFIDALNENPKAKEVFEKFSYSHKKEYLEWVIDAKTDATRQKRMLAAIEMMSEGKSRHWKYQ